MPFKLYACVCSQKIAKDSGPELAPAKPATAALRPFETRTWQEAAMDQVMIYDMLAMSACRQVKSL